MLLISGLITMIVLGWFLWPSDSATYCRRCLRWGDQLHGRCVSAPDHEHMLATATLETRPTLLPAQDPLSLSQTNVQHEPSDNRT